MFDDFKFQMLSFVLNSYKQFSLDSERADIENVWKLNTNENTQIFRESEMQRRTC